MVIFLNLDFQVKAVRVHLDTIGFVHEGTEGRGELRRILKAQKISSNRRSLHDAKQ